jgi:hypothetical protein
MRLRLSFLWAAVASAAGLVILLGFFLRSPQIDGLGQVLISLAVLLATAALLLGLLNLLNAHWNKVSLQDRGWPYSAILILALLVTFGLGVLFGPDYEVMLLLFNHVQLPVEASLMALLAVSLTVAGFRLLARKRDVLSLIFVVVACVVLLGATPWVIAGDSPQSAPFDYARNWLTQVWAAGGSRGILLGVALGAIATGLRVLLASDRPFGD